MLEAELTEIDQSDTARLAEVTMKGHRPSLMMATCLEQEEPAFYAWWQLVNKPNSEILRRLAEFYANLSEFERPKVLFPPQAEVAASKHSIDFMQVETGIRNFRILGKDGKIGSRLEAALARDGSTQNIDGQRSMMVSMPFVEALVTTDRWPTRTMRALTFHRLPQEIAALYAATADVKLEPTDCRQLGNILGNFSDENFSKRRNKLKVPGLK